jgi:hypothetical protein
MTAILAAICLWIAGAWLLGLSAATILTVGGGVFVLVMLREFWWSEKAYRAIERERHDHLASEREFGHRSRRERGD